MFRTLLLISAVLAVVNASAGLAAQPKTLSTAQPKKMQAMINKVFHEKPKSKAAAKAAQFQKEVAKRVSAAKTSKPEPVNPVPVPVPAAASLRGAAAAAVQMEEVKITNKSKLFSPNKGFYENLDYGFDWFCSSEPKGVYGSAVNFCYFDEETGTSSALVATLLKLPESSYLTSYYGAEQIYSTTFNFTDAQCGRANENVTEITFPTPRGCYYYSKTEHTLTPTVINNPETVMMYEYITEAGCANANVKELITYSSAPVADFDCLEYINIGEYFKMSCDSGVVHAQVYSDATCETFVRADDFANSCTDVSVTYPYRFTCGVAPPAP